MVGAVRETDRVIGKARRFCIQRKEKTHIFCLQSKYGTKNIFHITYFRALSYFSSPHALFSVRAAGTQAAALHFIDSMYRYVSLCITIGALRQMRFLQVLLAMIKLIL